MPANFRALGLVAAALGLVAACGDPEIKSDLNTEGPPDVNLVTVVSESVASSGITGEATIFCRDSGDGKVNEFYCFDNDDEQGFDTFDVVDAPALGWQMRIVFSELLQGDLVEDVIRDGNGAPLGGTIANTRPLTVDCGGANTDVAYDGFYDPTGNHLTDPPGPSLVVTIDEFVATGSTCTVTIKDDVVLDKEGLAVPSDQRSGYSFQISPLRINATTPGDEETGVAIDVAPAIQFNAPISEDSLGNLVTIVDDADPTTPLGASLVVAGQTVTIEPDVELTEGASYTVTVNAGLTDIDGGALNIDNPFTFSFTTVEPPAR